MIKIYPKLYFFLFAVVLALNLSLILPPGRALAWYISGSGALVCTHPDDVANWGLRCLEGIVENISRATLSILGVGLFLMLSFGGLRYITAGGDQKAVDSAKKTMTYAVVGFFTLLVGYFVLRALGQALGLDRLLKFEIPEKTV